MLKRYVAIPAPVVLTNEDTGESMKTAAGEPVPPVTFERFLKLCLFADPRWTLDYEGICSRSDILASVRAATDGIAVLSEDDWKLLDAVVAAPEHVIPSPMGPQRVRGFGGWMPDYIPQFKPFLDAIRNATTG